MTPKIGDRVRVKATQNQLWHIGLEWTGERLLGLTGTVTTLDHAEGADGVHNLYVRFEHAPDGLYGPFWFPPALLQVVEEVQFYVGEET